MYKRRDSSCVLATFYQATRNPIISVGEMQLYTYWEAPGWNGGRVLRIWESARGRHRTGNEPFHQWSRAIWLGTHSETWSNGDQDPGLPPSDIKMNWALH